jgi:hypothetical protein
MPIMVRILPTKMLAVVAVVGAADLAESYRPLSHQIGITAITSQQDLMMRLFRSRSDREHGVA